MFSFSKLSFMALVAAASFKSAMSVPTDVGTASTQSEKFLTVLQLATGNRTTRIGGTGGPSPAAGELVANVCPDPNFVHCIGLVTPGPGCYNLISQMNNVMSSAQVFPGFQCTFFE
ncbi:hypothetical protein C8J57DRAFT_1240481 [Mycena rebaudengoi]|nr:hypothetical protein C8J57DRAFT_1240481 [Mycena rebaudengoi]